MAETLQEFLVKLKYQSEGESRYLSGIKAAESSVMRLGKAFIAGGLAAGLWMGKYAARMEQLGFVARRTGTHVKNLLAFQSAGASLGSSAEGARESLEGLAAFMRNTPGSEGFLKELGVQTKDAHGHALDTVKVMENLGGAFRKMPVYMAHQYAGILGISDNMMLAMRSGKMDGLISKFRKPLDGAKLDKVSIVANQAMIAGRVFGMKKEAAEAKVALPVMQAFVAADAKTKGLSTDMLGLAKTLSEVAIATILLKGILKGVFGIGAAEALPGGATPKGGGIGRALSFAGKTLGAGVAAWGGWKAGSWLRQNFEPAKDLGNQLGDDIFSVLKTFHLVPGMSVVKANSPNHSVQNNQTVHIHVHGAKDPQDTARRVKEEIRMSAHHNQMATH